RSGHDLQAPPLRSRTKSAAPGPGRQQETPRAGSAMPPFHDIRGRAADGPQKRTICATLPRAMHPGKAPGLGGDPNTLLSVPAKHKRKDSGPLEHGRLEVQRNALVRSPHEIKDPCQEILLSTPSR